MRQPSAWRQTHEAQTGATCANKRNKRTRPKQAQATKPTRPKQAQASKPNQERTSANRRKRGRNSTKTLEPYGGKHLRQEFASGLPH